MKFQIFFLLMKSYYLFDKTPLYLAVEKGNLEMVKLLLSNKKIKVNLTCILITLCFIKLNAFNFS